MARSPLTLAASVTAALPEVEVTSTAPLTAGGEGRNDAAVVALADGRRVVVRLPGDVDTDAELATEALALHAMSDGVRALLGFTVPEFLGSAPLGDARVFVTTFIPGFLVDAEHLPAGRGVSSELGRALAQVHALPPSVVRSSGLPARSTADVRADARRVMEESAATGRVPVRLMVRWREAIEDDAMWRFEPTVTLGGADASAYVYEERDGEPRVAGVIDWRALQVTDPAVDLRFLANAPTAAATILDAYAAAAHRAVDEHLEARARLHSELEIAKWLLHGRDTHDTTVMDDAAAMLDALAEGVRDHTLRAPSSGGDIDDALAALQSVPSPQPLTIDTSMQTDTFDPDDLAFDLEGAHRELAASQRTQAVDADLLDLDTSVAPDPITVEPERAPTGDADDVAEAERAAQATIRRWSQD